MTTHTQMGIYIFAIDKKVYTRKWKFEVKKMKINWQGNDGKRDIKKEKRRKYKQEKKERKKERKKILKCSKEEKCVSTG